MTPHQVTWKMAYVGLWPVWKHHSRQLVFKGVPIFTRGWSKIEIRRVRAKGVPPILATPLSAIPLPLALLLFLLPEFENELENKGKGSFFSGAVLKWMIRGSGK